MTNNKLSPVKVYMAIKPEPSENNEPIKAQGISYLTGETLEQKERFIFSKEELEAVIKSAFEVFLYRGFPHNKPTFEQYIQSLF